MRKLFIATVAIVAASSPANAQDAFDGFYAGVSLGYDLQAGDKNEQISFDRGSNGSFNEVVTTAAGANAFAPGFCAGAARTPVNANCRSDSDGVAVHARMGYDVQMNQIIVGLVGEFGTADVRDSVSAFSITPAFYTMTRSIDYNAALRGRVGYALSQKTLAYATAGLAYARLDQAHVSNNTANSFAVLADRDAWGLQAGAGLEQKIGNHFSLGLEYLYTTYADDNTLVRVGRGTAGATNPFVLANGVDFLRVNDNFAYHSVKAVMAYRF